MAHFYIASQHRWPARHIRGNPAGRSGVAATLCTGLRRETDTVASYHFRVKQVRRSKGQNVVAAAAYRAGARLHDEASGRVADYSNRERGHSVRHSEIMAPEGSAEFLRDRERLWNTVEAMEKRRDAQLAREVELALPRELTDLQRVDLVRAFVSDHFVRVGMVADLAIHAPPEGSPDNHHAHILLTLRQATPTGLRPVKTREWNARELVSEWRESWGRYQNVALERAGHAARVDHRTLAAQRADAMTRGDRAEAASLDRVPEIHVGPKPREAIRGGRVPRSEDRVRGAPRARPAEFVRKGRAGANARQVDPVTGRRLVAYSRLDAGTRLDWATELARINRDRARAYVDRRQRQAARFRRAEMIYGRKVAELTRQLAGLDGHGGLLGGLVGRKGRDMERGRLEARRAHVQRRAALANLLVRDIEGILARLLTVQRGRIDRHQRLSREWRASQKRERGRERGREP
jgi:hypothetical protein